LILSKKYTLNGTSIFTRGNVFVIDSKKNSSLPDDPEEFVIIRRIFYEEA